MSEPNLGLYSRPSIIHCRRRRTKALPRAPASPPHPRRHLSPCRTLLRLSVTPPPISAARAAICSHCAPRAGQNAVGAGRYLPAKSCFCRWRAAAPRDDRTPGRRPAPLPPGQLMEQKGDRARRAALSGPSEPRCLPVRDCSPPRPSRRGRQARARRFFRAACRRWRSQGVVMGVERGRTRHKRL